MNRIKSFFRRFYRLCRTPYRLSSFLRSGTYCYNKSATVLYEVQIEDLVVSETNKNFTSSHINPVISVFTSFYKFKSRNTKSLFNADYVILTSSLKDYKLFDLSGNLVLTIYEDKVRYEKILKNRNKWSLYFPTLSYYQSNSIPAFNLIEPLIKKVDYDVSFIFEKILDQYIEYYSKDNNFVIRETSTSLHENDIDINHFCSYFKLDDDFEKISEVFKLVSSVKRLSHGDLWRSNILYDNKEIYYIDFECVDYRCFLYDTFMFMFSDYYYLNDMRLIDKFKNGDFDIKLSKLFALNKIVYDSNIRDLYMKSFVICTFYEKWYPEQEDTVRTKIVQLFNILKES